MMLINDEQRKKEYLNEFHKTDLNATIKNKAILTGNNHFNLLHCITIIATIH